MKPTDFLDTAFLLLKRASPREADRRSAVSRAYYSVYHAILPLIRTEISDEARKRAKIKNSRSRVNHHEMWEYLVKSNDSDVVLLSKEIQSLEEQRRQADYSLQEEYTYDHAADLVAEAANYHTRLRELKTERLVTALETGIEDYWKHR